MESRGCAGGAALFSGYFPAAVANTPVRSVNDSIAATGGYAGLCLAGTAILLLRYLYVLVRMLWR